MKQENKKLLEELSHTSYGIALKEFLDEEYSLLDDVSSCTSWEDTLGRQKAIKVLDKLFAFMGKKGIDTKQKNQYL